MSIKLVDTAVPMNDSGYPVARAKHIWFDDNETLQEKLEKGSLGTVSDKDKEDIVNSVIAALPNGNGVNY